MDSPLFDETAACHPFVDVPEQAPGQDPATVMISPVGRIEYGGHVDRLSPEPDPQSVAYREMGPGDVVLDEEIGEHVQRVHGPLSVAGRRLLLSPADWETERWDAGRVDPRPGT